MNTKLTCMKCEVSHLTTKGGLHFYPLFTERLRLPWAQFQALKGASEDGGLSNCFKRTKLLLVCMYVYVCISSA